MADKSIADLPVSGSMTDDALLALYQNGTTNSITGALIKSYAQNAVASQVTAAQTAANQAGQSATQAEAARQGAAAAQTAAESAQDAAETARDQSVAAAGTIGDSVEQAQTAAGQASSAKDAAVAAQSAAEAAKTAAETASGQAQTAATQASGSATAAQTAATQAGDAKTDAETARNEAETSASSAANSASDAESAAAEAEQAKTYIENMNMEGETLPAGSSVTVTKTTSPDGNLLFVIGVPKGIQGDKGETGETGATGPQGVSVTNATVNEDGDLVITLSAGEPINAGSVIGPKGIQGEVGPTGASVDRIERTSGTGAPGTTDTYTVYLTNGQTGGTFQVYNGSNGTGSGDFMADGSVPMTGDLQMGGHVVTGMADGTNPTDGATVGQLAGKLDSPDGGTAGQVLTKTADGSAWEDAPSGLPDGGTEGQMLYKSADGAVWGDKPVMYVNITESVGTYSADKKLSEIKDAYQKGFSIIANTPNGIIPMTSIYKYATFMEFDIDHKRTNEYLVGEDRVIYQMTAMSNFASDVSYDRYASGLRATNVQDAIDEVQENVENVLPSGGTPGQVLTKTSTGEEWSDAPSGLPEGGAEGQMLYQSANGAEWGIPPYLGSMPQLDYSQMKSLHALGITDLNDVVEPGTYVGMSGLGGYPEIAHVPYFASGIPAFFLNVYKFVYPDDSDLVSIIQRCYPIAPAGDEGGFFRYTPSEVPESWPVKWTKVQDANSIAFTPGTTGLTSDNVQDAIEEVDTQLSTKLTTPPGTQGQLLGFTANNTVGAVDAPESGLTQEQADERYLQLTGGELNDDAIFQLPGDNGSLYLGGRNNVPNVGMYADSSGYITLHDNTMGNVNIRGVRSPESDYDAANKSYVDSKSPTSVAITLTTSGWSSNTQTVTVSGVSATETAQLITPTPAIASQSAYYEAGIMCTGQAANSLTFTCQTVPTSNLIVYVVIQPLG